MSMFEIEDIPEPAFTPPKLPNFKGYYARRDRHVYYVVGHTNGVRKVLIMTREEFIELYDNMGRTLDAVQFEHNINGLEIKRGR